MRGLVKWFVGNPIAANLLMLAMLVGGFVSYSAVEKEAFPRYEANIINIGMPYPSAAPAEVEQQIVVRIEEAIADLPGIYQITSESREGFGNVTVQVNEGSDLRELLNDIKGRVDAINTFPPSAERPVVSQFVFRETLMWVALYGDADRRQLKNWAYQIRDEMSLLEGVSEVSINGVKNDEVSIEVSEDTLRRYNLSFDEVANAIRGASLNVPAGLIRSKDGDIQIQTRAQAYDYRDFADIVVRSGRDGSRLMLTDIAHIDDGFTEQNVSFFMNGKPGVNLEVKMSDDPLLFEGTENARQYIKEFRELLPPGVELKINYEAKDIFDSRFNMLTDNAVSGLFLVFIILMLFLRPMLALWVVAGIATTFAGSIWLLPYLGVSINMLSMFAFLMVLGIVVDDAIIVGESIYRHQQRGETGELASVSGTRTVLRPVFLAVVSTIVFFLPMIDVPSDIVVYTRSIFWVVFLCLVFSLIESLLVLPSHLSHLKPETPSRFSVGRAMSRVRHMFSDGMERFANDRYQPALGKMLQRKGSTFLGFTFIFAIAVTIVVAGWVNTSFFPQVPNAAIQVNIEFSEGAPFSQTERTAQYVRDQIELVSQDEELLEANRGDEFIREVNRTLNATNASIFIGLTEEEVRHVSAQQISDKLREKIGPLPEAKSYSLSSTLAGGGADITLNMSMLDNRRELQEGAISKIATALEAYPGVYNVRNNLDTERTEVEVELKPYAQSLGITLSDVATQVRQGFYGVEIQRIPRAKEDVRVMLRYTFEERSTLDTLDNIRIRTSDGRELPIAAVAEINLVPGTSTIRRVDRKRNISITAEVEDGHDANQIAQELLNANLDQWRRDYLGFNLSLDGALRSQAQFGDNFALNFLKVFVAVMAIFAIAFRSLFQPLLVMLAVPFGFVGAVLGHLIVGVDFSLFSGFGFLACSGVVVNDNLVLLERINTLRSRGETSLNAVLKAGVDRFRPIVLTSLTTFIGLMPILFERSLQAQFLKPMVISLSFGVLFSSVVTLFLVPCVYYIGDRTKAMVARRLGKGGDSSVETAELSS
ncbi:efflux RND transporter permease subunit [Gilvimarinus sp. SDUM040013]|uniref:Efflux RND transporter permease subunit n=1 Tax=Gilvimarinus gilvus TaxID=3058038 RepID=A0ABU4RZ96_9GAMM|nr:efflux RND transporter permease subunit [Gilvimarinus sp. SDUM040013]MDO3386363.1 efflux RND transporter permease subunit [Gilvimarinus sp. SDUM040013]MDX6849979.1 efflux RND transporter permease subunit [Gilvimarinus sp. SDUM040013]